MLLSLAGCDGDPAVRVYVAPKADTEFVAGPLAGNGKLSSPDNVSSQKRILGAVIPLDGACVFLKATDRPERFDSILEDFYDVVANFAVDAGTGMPNGRLPDGWTMRARNDIAKAEYVVKIDDGELKFTVTELGMPGANEWESYLLGNINRWRGQLKLADIKPDALSSELIEVKREGAKLPAYIFDAVGTGSGGMASGAPPFASGGGPASASSAMPQDALHANVNKSKEPKAQSPTQSAAAAEAPQAPVLSYTLPDSWKEAEGMPFRLATFAIKSDAGDGEATVSLAVNNPEANAAMWFQQLLRESDEVALKTLTESALSKAETISSWKGDALLYSIRASEQVDEPVMFVAAIPSDIDGMHLFVKLRGEPKLVYSEKGNLVQFVKSLTWK